MSSNIEERNVIISKISSYCSFRANNTTQLTELILDYMREIIATYAQPGLELLECMICLKEMCDENVSNKLSHFNKHY